MVRKAKVRKRQTGTVYGVVYKTGSKHGGRGKLTRTTSMMRKGRYTKATRKAK